MREKKNEKKINNSTISADLVSIDLYGDSFCVVKPETEKMLPIEFVANAI